MRVSNLQFSKGAVVFAEFPPTSADNFMNNRPLIVVSNPIPVFNQVVVCQTGTKMKPGIQIRLWNYQTNRAVGTTEISTAYPYNLVTIKTENIIRCIGHIDPYTMKAIDKAIGFFLGFNDEVPEFLRGQENEFFSVGYTYANPSHIYDERVGEVYQRRVSFDNRVATPTFVPDDGKPISDSISAPSTVTPTPKATGVAPTSNFPMPVPDPKPATTTVKKTPAKKVSKEKTPQEKKSFYFYTNPTVEAFLAKYTDNVPSKSITARELREAYDRVRKTEGWEEFSPQGFGKAVAAHVSLTDNNITIGRTSKGLALYKGLALRMTEEEKRGEEIQNLTNDMRNWMLNVSDIDLPLPEEDAQLLVNLGIDDACMIVSRRVTVGAISYKYKIEKQLAEQLQYRLTRYAIEVGNSAINFIKNSPDGIKKYNAFFKLGIALVTQFSTIPKTAKLRIRLNENTVNMKSMFRINFDDVIWNKFRETYFPEVKS